MAASASARQSYPVLIPLIVARECKRIADGGPVQLRLQQSGDGALTRFHLLTAPSRGPAGPCRSGLQSTLGNVRFPSKSNHGADIAGGLKSAKIPPLGIVRSAAYATWPPTQA